MAFLAGPIILGKHMHFFTAKFWGFYRVFETLDGHCGYDFPWSPFRLVPFCADASYHDFHHSQNVGNYGSFMTIWDTILDTNTEYYAHQIKKEKSKTE